VKRPQLLDRRVTFTWKYLDESALFLIRQAKKLDKGDESVFYYCMSSILSSAFCIEAYLNHVGKELFPFWDDLEKRLNTKGKMQLITHHESVKAILDFSRRPDQSLETLRKFRNLLVHGKTTERSIKRHIGEDTSSLMPYWEELCTLENAERFLSDVEDMISKIHGRMHNNESPFDGELAVRIISVAQ
jgi:hypothetical protein